MPFDPLTGTGCSSAASFGSDPTERKKRDCEYQEYFWRCVGARIRVYCNGRKECLESAGRLLLVMYNNCAGFCDRADCRKARDAATEELQKPLK